MPNTRSCAAAASLLAVVCAVGVIAVGIVAGAEGGERGGAPKRGDAATRPAAPPKRVAFVLDASGSMKALWPAVRAEVVKAVGGMDAGTAFDVVVGADKKSWRFRGKPVPATPEMAEKLHDWLSDRKAGRYTSVTEPAEQVLAAAPDVLWLVTDGDLPNRKEFLERVARANPGRRTRVNVVMPVLEEPDETRDEMIAFLKQVAADNGGKFAMRQLPELSEVARDGVGIPRGRSIFRE